MTKLEEIMDTVIEYFDENNLSKIEQKIIELGYKKIKTVQFEGDLIPYVYFKKEHSNNINIYIVLYNDKIDDYGVDNGYQLITQRTVIKRLREAFNLMKQDLKNIKECEE